MFKLDNYLEFLLEKSSSGKMKIYYSKRLREIFKDIKFRDPGNIVSILLQMENKEEYLDKFTLVDISEDKNDVVTFLQVNRILRNDKDIEGTSLPQNIIDAQSNYLTKYRTEVGLGRWASRVINEIAQKPVMPSQISRLVDFYRSVYDEEHNKESMFDLISGEKIRHWYNEDNYHKHIGQLGNSCMRYNYISDYFDIYVYNPEVCSLLIMYNDSKNKIVGRSLIWKLVDGSFYQDRIYTNYDSDMFAMKNWATSRNYLTYDKEDIPIMKVQLNPKEYEYYPYMDTFLCYNPETGVLSSDADLWPGQGFIKLQDPEGGYISDKVYYSRYHDDMLEESEAVLAIGPDGEEDYFRHIEVREVKGKKYFQELLAWSSYYGSYIVMDESIYSEILDEFLDPDDPDVIEVIFNDLGRTDYTLKHRKDTYIEKDGKFYYSDKFIINPYTKEFIYLSKGTKVDIKKKILEEFEIKKLEDIYRLLKTIYDESRYDRDSLLNQIKENNLYNDKIRGIYWGFPPDKVPTNEDLLYGAFAYITYTYNNNLHDCVYKIFNDDELYQMYYNYNRRDNRLVKIILQIYSQLDYSKISQEMYKIFLVTKVF